MMDADWPPRISRGEGVLSEVDRETPRVSGELLRYTTRSRPVTRSVVGSKRASIE